MLSQQTGYVLADPIDKVHHHQNLSAWLMSINFPVRFSIMSYPLVEKNNNQSVFHKSSFMLVRPQNISISNG